MLRILCACLFFQVVLAKPGFGPTDQEWGYIKVDPNRNLFWWLHYTTANVTKYTERPLIIWLQGGPGSSSTGYGNFAEIGPLDLDLKPRDSSWVQYANILFIDVPAGSGFSYVVDGLVGYNSNNTQISNDMIIFLTKFYETLPVFKNVPLYIFSEAYGGKIAVETALLLDQATKNGQIEANLKGLGLGSPFLSPLDSIFEYAPFLMNLGHIEEEGYAKIMEVANTIKHYYDLGDMKEASSYWPVVTLECEEQTHGINLYNILDQEYNWDQYRNYMGLYRYNEDVDKTLSYIMNTLVREKLGIPDYNDEVDFIIWQDLNTFVWGELILDILNPVTNLVERLLNETDIKIAVYSGQLDVIVPVKGTINWVRKLNFKDKAKWQKAPREGLLHNDYYEGYVQKHKNFALYSIERSGHFIPDDNPNAMYEILKDVTNNFRV